jgi:signal transduction histidine kinase
VVEIFPFLRPATHVPDQYKRQVHITNILSFIFCWITLGILAIFYSLFGWIDTLSYILAVAVLFLLGPVFNRWLSHRFGRTVFCLIPVWLTMFVTLYFKLEESAITYIFYFDSRFILMATPILPGLVFRLEERQQLFICLGSSAIAMLFYDPIHQFFGAGYFEMGFSDPSYHYINYIAAITFSVLVAGILLMRSVLEKSEAALAGRNRDLQEKQNEIEAQHEELLQHQEEMMSSSEKLADAYAVITKQQTVMEKYNSRLEALVTKKSEELKRTNEELIKHNNELIQFSYTVSHNLRGPVARLLGLARLFKVSDEAEEKQHMQDLIFRSTEELDEILKDLSLIIDIRNDLYRVREKVYLQDEWAKARTFLEENIKAEFNFDVDFSEVPFIFGVRPMVQSIFYNLLSNAIKYQNPDEVLKVRVRSYSLSPIKTVVEVRDNGLGIDLKNQEKDVFKLYKRFHSHIAGKGLGLYLVKTQVEALGGKITVESKPGKGTTFKLVFTQPDEVSKQIFHENDAVQLYYDGNLKITVIVWKRKITSEEYRDTFRRVLDSLKIYKTPGWISDIRKQGMVSEDDQKWLLRTLAPDAIKSGLRQIAVVGIDAIEPTPYHKLIEKVTAENGIRFRSFNAIDDALKWMKDTLG